MLAPAMGVHEVKESKKGKHNELQQRISDLIRRVPIQHITMS